MLNKKWKKDIKWPLLFSGICHKEKKTDGCCIIYVFGMKVFSYKKYKTLVSNNYKYIHVMWNDKFNKPFVDFLNRNFDASEHLILCKHIFQQFPFPEGDNVVEIENLKGLKLTKDQKLICHSLFDDELVDWLYRNKSILKKQAYWVIWGGDLYNAPRDKKNDFVRKNFKGYMVFANNDKKVLIDKYGTVANSFYPIEYPLCLDVSSIEPIKNDFLKIQINNSADDTTLEMLDVLSKFKNENIKITTILSYGKIEYKDEIIKKGKEIFGDKFEYLDKMLSPLDYAKHIASLDVFIANQNRQQATANIDMCLYFNKKVFIKSNISTFDMYTSLGYKIFDTYSIDEQTFSEFKKYEINKNHDLAQYYISDEYRKKLWKDVLND